MPVHPSNLNLFVRYHFNVQSHACTYPVLFVRYHFNVQPHACTYLVLFVRYHFNVRPHACTYLLLCVWYHFNVQPHACTYLVLFDDALAVDSDLLSLLLRLLQLHHHLVQLDLCLLARKDVN